MVDRELLPGILDPVGRPPSERHPRGLCGVDVPDLECGGGGEPEVHLVALRRIVAASPAIWRVDYVRRKPAPREAGVPALASVGRRLVDLSRVAAAMHHDDRIAVLLLVRDLVLDVHLVDRDVAGHEARVTGRGGVGIAELDRAPDVEAALLVEHQQLGRLRLFLFLLFLLFGLVRLLRLLRTVPLCVRGRSGEQEGDDQPGRRR